MLPSDPAKEVDLPEPVVNDADCLVWVVVKGHGKMEAVVPEKSSWENEARRRESEGIVKLVLEKGVLCVKNAVVEGRASVKIEKCMS